MPPTAAMLASVDMPPAAAAAAAAGGGCAEHDLSNRICLRPSVGKTATSVELFLHEHPYHHGSGFHC